MRSRPPSAGSRWARTRSRSRPASSSAPAREACWPRWTGGRCSGSTFLWGCTERGGPTASCGTMVSGTVAGSTGGATSRSASAWALCWSPRPTASSRTAGTRWAGRTPGCSPGWSAAWPCWWCSASSRPGWAEPMFQLSLFRIRAFTAGNLAGLATSIARGGLQFMLIIWLQGIWLPLHGYNFSDTPLWAGIFLLPLTAGFLVSGPVSGTLSDRFGSRGIATSGMAVFGGSFIGLMLLLPANFPYWAFALLIAANGIGSGMFASPNSSSVMGSVPAAQRGVASGMRSTFQNSGTAGWIAGFFSLLFAGLASSLPKTLTSGLQQQGVPHTIAHQIGALPPVSSLFAAVLGVNPVQHLLAAGGVLSSLPAASQRILTGREFFPNLISVPFHHGLVIVFAVSAALAALAGLASLLRGGRQAVADERPQADEHPKPLNRRVG